MEPTAASTDASAFTCRLRSERFHDALPVACKVPPIVRSSSALVPAKSFSAPREIPSSFTCAAPTCSPARSRTVARASTFPDSREALSERTSASPFTNAYDARTAPNSARTCHACSDAWHEKLQAVAAQRAIHGDPVQRRLVGLGGVLGVSVQLSHAQWQLRDVQQPSQLARVHRCVIHGRHARIVEIVKCPGKCYRRCSTVQLCLSYIYMQRSHLKVSAQRVRNWLIPISLEATIRIRNLSRVKLPRGIVCRVQRQLAQICVKCDPPVVVIELAFIQHHAADGKVEERLHSGVPAAALLKCWKVVVAVGIYANLQYPMMHCKFAEIPSPPQQRNYANANSRLLHLYERRIGVRGRTVYYEAILDRPSD